MGGVPLRVLTGVGRLLLVPHRPVFLVLLGLRLAGMIFPAGAIVGPALRVRGVGRVLARSGVVAVAGVLRLFLLVVIRLLVRVRRGVEFRGRAAVECVARARVPGFVLGGLALPGSGGVVPARHVGVNAILRLLGGIRVRCRLLFFGGRPGRVG